MPRSNKATLWHSLNTLVAIVNELVSYQKAIFLVHGDDAAPIVERLTMIEQLLPTLLNLNGEKVTPEEIAAAQSITPAQVIANTDVDG